MRFPQFFLTISVLTLACALAGAGCASSDPGDEGGHGDAGAPDAPAGDNGGAGGHGGDSGTTAASGGMIWTIPEGWIEEEPSNDMRTAQYRVPGTDGDAEFTVFTFGPGQGGDPMANARRWAGQFEQPDGRPSQEVMRISRMELESARVLLVEVGGTFTGGGMPGADPAEPMPGWMMLGAIAEGPGSNWFFKLTGPEETIRENRRNFRDLVKSLEAAGADA